MHEYCYDEMQRFRDKYLLPSPKHPINVLDIGSQDINGTFKDLFKGDNWHYKGLDIEDGDNVDFIPKNTYFWDELKSCSYDVVISGQAFEHTEYFWLSILEIARILKFGGFVCIISPSAGFEHRYPVDCYRFYRDGMTAIAHFAGIKVWESKTNFEVSKSYKDGSHFWKDSTLIGQKEKSSWKEQFLRKIHRKIARKVWA
jgi:SAM-dependent methyltransferase